MRDLVRFDVPRVLAYQHETSQSGARAHLARVPGTAKIARPMKNDTGGGERLREFRNVRFPRGWFTLKPTDLRVINCDNASRRMLSTVSVANTTGP